ncbi:MAG TPA: C39 family peptidase [Candidatus Saccharimonadales bacterium]|nr:C39 family peptidase [Candidatus Saccharimonadales bacterium]
MEVTLTHRQETKYDCPPGFVGRSIVHFDMHDPRWEEAEYAYADGALPPAKLGVTGCVPTTLAEVASTFHNTFIFPNQVAELLESAHTKNGTAVDKALDIFCRVYQLQVVDKIQVSSLVEVEKLRDHLANGHIVIASFNSESPFTNAAHVIVIRGISEDLQRFMVVDNNDTDQYQEGKLPNRNQTEFSTFDLPQWLKNGCWVISKQPEASSEMLN